MTKNRIEDTRLLKLDFQKLKKVAKCGDLIPAVAQDVKTKQVLIIGYINKEALRYTIKHKVVCFWSTSRNKLWIKGETSGDYLDLVDIRINCEQNSILYLVKLRGTGACHTLNNKGKAHYTCFYRRLVQDRLEFL